MADEEPEGQAIPGLKLPKNASDFLRRLEVRTIQQLCSMSRRELEEASKNDPKGGIGPASMSAIEVALEQDGRSLRQDDSPK